MFDVGGNDMLSFFGIGQGHPFDGLVNGLGPTGSKNHLLRRGAVDQTGCRLPGLFQGLGGQVTHLVGAGRITGLARWPRSWPPVLPAKAGLAER